MTRPVIGSRLAAAAFFASGLLLGEPERAAAFGAIAIGETGNVAKGGVAVGLSRNYPSKDAAEARALKECLAFADASVATRGLCKIVASFEKQCYAVALDPKAGTPGFGWVIHKTEVAAKDEAMNRCARTAGKSRQKFCKVTVSSCDTTNKPSD